MRVSGVLTALAILTIACMSRGEAEVSDKASDEEAVPSGVRIELNQSGYTYGDVCTVTVSNETDRVVYYHLGCQSSIQCYDGEAWTEAYKMDCSHIRVRPTKLEPGATAQERYDVPPAAAFSSSECTEYRMLLSVNGVAVHSAPFKIEHDKE